MSGLEGPWPEKLIDYTVATGGWIIFVLFFA